MATFRVTNPTGGIPAMKGDTAMQKPITEVEVWSSREWWNHLETFVRDHIQQFVQRLLGEEVTLRLGRAKSVRRVAVDASAGYRNGYGQPRKLALTCGTITVQRPRVRGLVERFVSRLLPLFKRRTKEVGELLPQLYLHGLALGDFELALRGLLGEGAPLSPASLQRLKAQWQCEYATWKRRRLDELEVVSVRADGLYVKAETKAALLVVTGALTDGRKVVLAVESEQRESKESGVPCYGICAPEGSSSGVAPAPMAIWGSGRRWSSSSPWPPSNIAGTTGSSPCWMPCRCTSSRGRRPCSKRCRMRRRRRRVSSYETSSAAGIARGCRRR